MSNSRFDKTAPLEQRFWRNVDKDGPIHPIHGQCWVWVPTRTRGRIRINGKTHNAPRASWIIHFEEIPEGLCVLHKCDNPKCVNPSHLFLGTYRDNSLDSVAKGRYNCESRGSPGESNGSSKLTKEDVIEIRKLAVSGTGVVNTGTTTMLSCRFGVSRAQIRNIATGRSWKNV
jgi:hypothetical protein